MMGYGSQNSFAQWEQIRDKNQAFSSTAAWSTTSFNINPSGEVRNVGGGYVTGNYFNLLGVRPALGRLLNPSDDVNGCGNPALVISYPFWRREFAQDPSVLGRKLTLDGQPFSIVGVSEPNFSGLEVGRRFDLAIPACAAALMRLEDNPIVGLDHFWLVVVGRLKPGWTVEKASAQLQAISGDIFRQTLPTQYTEEDRKNYLNFGLKAVPGDTGTSGLRNAYSTPLSLLLAITGLVLLIACANLANLMLARASAREREIAIRLALGAARGRLIRQLLTESLLIASIGAVAGLVIAHNVSRLMVGFLSTQDRPIYIDLSPDWRLFGFTALVALVTCALFGLAPALRATNTAPSRAMNAAGRSMTSSRERNGLRRALVVSQVALSLVLVTCALLFVRSLNHLLDMDTGFEREGVLVTNLDLSSLKLPPEQRTIYKQQLLRRISALPGVESAAQTNIVPVSNSGWNENILVAHKRAGLANFMRTSPNFLGTMRIPLLLGRDFEERDSAEAPKVAIVNQLFAEKVLKTANPIGVTFATRSYESKPPIVYQVVGMVKNTAYQDLRDEFEPLVMVPSSQDTEPDLFPSYVTRTGLPMQTISAEVKEALLRENSSIAIEFHVFKTQIAESLARERMLASLSGFFGLLAGVLAVVGIYGVISYMVVRRTNEIGIRMALGATRIDILRLILSEAGVLLGVGLTIGTALAFVVARSAASLLYGLKPTDLATYAGAIGTLTCVTVAASMLPAQRAASLDPMVALRDE
jgi:predicted permease